MTRGWRLACAVVLGSVLLGCRIPNEEHCGRREHDATCRAIDPARPYCSLCEAEHDGCVESLAQISVECRGEQLGTESETSASTTTDSETDTGTLDTSDTDTDTETGSSPECGNGVKEPGEDCDGNDFGDSTCADPFALPEGTLVCVPGECVIDTSQCCLADGEVCEQGECCNANCNIVTNKCGL